jgi:predicted amidophosphoribosyltransferase
MALINCKECGNEMSDTAASCPKCGATISEQEQCPQTSIRIRDVFAPIIIAVMITAIAIAMSSSIWESLHPLLFFGL